MTPEKSEMNRTIGSQKMGPRKMSSGQMSSGQVYGSRTTGSWTNGSLTTRQSAWFDATTSVKRENLDCYCSALGA